jgi:hypothetical protein
MTLAASALLDKRLARVESENATRHRATVLPKTSRAVLDNELSDLVIWFGGRRYAATREAIEHFTAQGIAIELPAPIKKKSRIKSELPEIASTCVIEAPSFPERAGRMPPKGRELTPRERFRLKIYHNGKDPSDFAGIVKT